MIEMSITCDNPTTQPLFSVSHVTPMKINFIFSLNRSCRQKNNVAVGFVIKWESVYDVLLMGERRA